MKKEKFDVLQSEECGVEGVQPRCDEDDVGVRGDDLVCGLVCEVASSDGSAGLCSRHSAGDPDHGNAGGDGDLPARREGRVSALGHDPGASVGNWCGAGGDDGGGLSGGL